MRTISQLKADLRKFMRGKDFIDIHSHVDRLRASDKSICTEAGTNTGFSIEEAVGVLQPLFTATTMYVVPFKGLEAWPAYNENMLSICAKAELPDGYKVVPVPRLRFSSAENASSAYTALKAFIAKSPQTNVVKLGQASGEGYTKNTLKLILPALAMCKSLGVKAALMSAPDSEYAVDWYEDLAAEAEGISIVALHSGFGRFAPAGMDLEKHRELTLRAASRFLELAERVGNLYGSTSLLVDYFNEPWCAGYKEKLIQYLIKTQGRKFIADMGLGFQTTDHNLVGALEIIRAVEAKAGREIADAVLKNMFYGNAHRILR